MPNVTIRVHIFTYTFILVTLVTALFTGLQYYFSKQLATDATLQDFHLIASQIKSDIQHSDEMAKETLYQMQNYPEIQKPFTKKLNMRLVQRYIYTLKRSNSIVAMYSVNAKEEFIEVMHYTQPSDESEGHIKIPRSSRWLVYTITKKGKGREKCTYYLDDRLVVLAEHHEKTDFIPSQRPWYEMTEGSYEAVHGAPYLFATLKVQGISYAKKIDGSNSVIGLDLSLAGISERIKQYRFADSSNLMLFGSDGKIIASTNSDISADTFLINKFLKHPQVHTMKIEDISGKHFVMISRISSDRGYDTYVGVSVLKAEMLAPYYEKLYVALLAALGLFILTIPFTLMSTNIIVRPINAVMVENSKINRRAFDEVVQVKSNIIELNRLSLSLVEMSESIQAYQIAQKELMDSFIKLIADAIDAKSPYTGGHCQRVPLIATMLVEEACKADGGSLEHFAFTTAEEFEEFERGAWLHDCGKITTPEYVVDKSSKLETIYNRIHEVRTRFEVIWRDIDIAYLENLMEGEAIEKLDRWREEERTKLIEDFNFVAECNMGGEFMSSEHKERIVKISQRTWIRHFDDSLGLSGDEALRYKKQSSSNVLPVQEKLLSDRAEHIVERVNFDEATYKEQGFKLTVPEHLYNYGEVYNLCIERGTLTQEERFKIQEHVIMSIKMLEQLPYTDDMKRIPEYAGTHHETLIGTGYPRELNADELSIPAKIMAIADIFEALTASDRPYKKGKTLSQALQIMKFMVKDQHIDAELFALFLHSGIYLTYAKAHLKEEQIDAVDVEAYL